MGSCQIRGATRDGWALYSFYFTSTTCQVTSTAPCACLWMIVSCILTIKDQSDSSKLQLDLAHTLSKWQVMWQMRFNASKCFVLRLSHARSTKQVNYTLDGTTLQETTSHSYLGVEITNDLKWGNHTQSISAKANRALGFIRRNLHCCPQDLKSITYQTLVRPLLGYSSIIWDPYTQEQKDKLEKI